MYAAYFYQCKCFVARFGDWKYLYKDIPKAAEWILNERLKRVTIEQIQEAVIKREENQISSIHFSNEKVQDEFNSF